MTIEGQVDLFEAMGEAPPPPPFTVYTCVWAERGCGWCQSNGFEGGGACRNPRDASESLFYSYCGKCRTRYGYPRVGDPDYPVIIDRTQKEKPEKPRRETDVSE